MKTSSPLFYYASPYAHQQYLPFLERSVTQARRNLISLSDTPYYHCINRAVRGAFLCREDRRKK